MSTSLATEIQRFYDASSNLWEQVWGEHMHHGYYGADGTQAKPRRQAQIDLIDQLLTWGQVTQAAHILDVGCGIGGSTLELAQRFGAVATGVTLSPVQAQRGRDRAQAAHLTIGPPTARFLVADALALPFADHTFDLVWSLESGEHMPDKTRFLAECWRVLKPGGQLLLATWCHRETQTRPLTADERWHLAEIYRVYRLPYVLALSDYGAIAQQVGFQHIQTADWSTAVAPFWDEVILSALDWRVIPALLQAGWSTVQAALFLDLMRSGYRRQLVRFGVLQGFKSA